MSDTLKDKIAIVTGARRGIGKEIALKLAKEGAKVVVTDISQEDCQKVVEEIEKLESEGLALKLDVTNEEDIKNAVAKTKEKFGKIDILVNNAGICLLEDIKNLDLGVVEKILNINLKGLIELTYAILPEMIAKKYGKIINIASIAALVSWSKIHTYSASKGGVIGFTKGLAGDVAQYGINVNAIAPGAIETPMLDSILKELRMTREQVCQFTPKGRIGKPEDIANACRFLASDEADFITGQVLIVDGGYSIK
ncbi:glucose 1-dehydrogenase [bacterium]|nr:glucose 1-dehydrogenase [bacterium]